MSGAPVNGWADKENADFYPQKWKVLEGNMNESDRERRKERHGSASLIRCHYVPLHSPREFTSFLIIRRT
jgi:hypothetical protein